MRNTLCMELMGPFSNLVTIAGGEIINALGGWILRTSAAAAGLALHHASQACPRIFCGERKRIHPWRPVSPGSCRWRITEQTVAGVGPVVCREAAWRTFGRRTSPPTRLTDAQKRSLMAAIDELKELRRRLSLQRHHRTASQWVYFLPSQRWRASTPSGVAVSGDAGGCMPRRDR